MSDTLVIYFSNTNTTKKVAEELAKKLNADTYRIEAAQPYTPADLNWRNDSCRANREQRDDNAHPSYAGQLPDTSEYSRIVIGHPTWWGIPPKIIGTVIKDLNLNGKEVATFSTSGGSGYSQAQEWIDRWLSKKGCKVIPGNVLNNEEARKKWLDNLN